jgi:hypothetical protein
MNTPVRIIRQLALAAVVRSRWLVAIGGLLAGLGSSPAAAGNGPAPACGGPIPELGAVLAATKPLDLFQACFVNAVRFAEGFRRTIPAERAEIIRISVRLPQRAGSRLEGNRTEAHVLVAFTFLQRNYLWDQGLGVFAGPPGDITLPEYSLTVERTVQLRMGEGFAAADGGRCRLTTASSSPKTEAARQAALHELFSHFPSTVPAYRVEAHLADGRTVAGAAIVFDHFFGVYLPSLGTLLSARTDRQRLEIDDPSPYIGQAMAEVDQTRIVDLRVARTMSDLTRAGTAKNECC